MIIIHLLSPCPSNSDALFTVKNESVYFQCTVSDNHKHVELFWLKGTKVKQATFTKVPGTSATKVDKLDDFMFKTGSYSSRLFL